MLVNLLGVVFVFHFVFKEVFQIKQNHEYDKLIRGTKFNHIFTRKENNPTRTFQMGLGRLMFGYKIAMFVKSNGFMVKSQVILLEMAKFEVFTKSSGMRTHIPKALVVTVLGPQNDHNTNAAKSLRSFAKQLEISGVKVRKTVAV